MRNPTKFSAISMVALLAMGGILSAQTAPPAGAPPPKTPGFIEFSDRVKAYAKVHGDAESNVYSLQKTNQPEVIATGQLLLAKSIREMRPDAHQGDLFTPAATQDFKLTIKMAFSGKHGTHAAETLKQGDPLKGFKVDVNQAYPDGLPFTTVPPTLLQKLPRLPDQVSYRILGSTLLLVDDKANLIVDFIPNALPQKGGGA